MAKPETGTRKRTSRESKTVERPPSNFDAARRAAVLDLGRPMIRPLKAYAFDPSLGTLLGNRMAMAVRYEDLDAGPVVRDPFAWDGIAVVDYDASKNTSRTVLRASQFYLRARHKGVPSIYPRTD